LPHKRLFLAGAISESIFHDCAISGTLPRNFLSLSSCTLVPNQNGCLTKAKPDNLSALFKKFSSQNGKKHGQKSDYGLKQKV
jgi:hypothetical protein